MCLFRCKLVVVRGRAACRRESVARLALGDTAVTTGDIYIYIYIEQLTIYINETQHSKYYQNTHT